MRSTSPKSRICSGNRNGVKDCQGMGTQGKSTLFMLQRDTYVDGLIRFDTPVEGQRVDGRQLVPAFIKSRDLKRETYSMYKILYEIQ